MAKEAIFNSRKRRVYRKYIPLVENLSGILLLLVLAGIAFWFLGQKENFDPQERDVSLEQLLEDSQTQQLYNLPLKQWVEPGTKQTASSAAPDLGNFPQDIIGNQWQTQSRLKKFKSENLFEKINGEAEKFLRQGFVSMHYVVLESSTGEEEIAIELYDQGDVMGSMGVFSDHLTGDKTIQQTNETIYFSTSVGAIGRKGRFFFRIAGNDVADSITQKTLDLVQSFSKLPSSEEESPPELMILSRGLKIPPGKISFQAQNVFQYDFVEKFWFGGLEGNTKVFIHQAPSEEEARSLYESILEEQRYEYEIKEEKRTRVVMFHQFLKNYFVMRYKGKFIFGVENGTDPEQTESLMEQFYKEISTNG